MTDAVSRSHSRHPELVSGSIASAELGKPRKPQFTSKVPPSGVAFRGQIDLPLPSPVFDLLFTGDSLVHRAKHLKMDEQVGVLPLGKAVESSVPMLSNAGYQVGCNTCIDRPPITASHEVNARLDDALHTAQCAVRWTLKQVQGDERVVP